MNLNNRGERLNLEEIENLQEPPRACPDCKSAEGYWLIAKRDSTFFQCKHCAAVFETRKFFAPRKEQKKFKLIIKLRR
jgi:ribosomal protein L37AE/L43A